MSVRLMFEVVFDALRGFDAIEGLLVKTHRTWLLTTSLANISLIVQTCFRSFKRDWALQRSIECFSAWMTFLMLENAFELEWRIKHRQNMLFKTAEIWSVEVFDDGDQESDFCLITHFNVDQRIKPSIDVQTRWSTFERRFWTQTKTFYFDGELSKPILGCPNHLKIGLCRFFDVENPNMIFVWIACFELNSIKQLRSSIKHVVEVQKATFSFDRELTKRILRCPNDLKFGLGRFFNMENPNMIFVWRAF